MRFFKWMSLVVLIALPVCGIVLAQETQTKTAPGGMKMMRFSADNAFIVGEIGAVITEEKGIIKVLMIPPKEQRPKEMQEVDVAIGDEVGMAAGKRIKSLKELKDAYAQATIGEVFKLGVRREGTGACCFVCQERREGHAARSDDCPSGRTRRQ